jgi:D-glycero-beta-D-manno-heptose 1-phosphate adenylyltransferase
MPSPQSSPAIAQWSIAYKEKIIEPSQLSQRVNTLRTQQQTIATLNGSFDLLHAGHLQIIFEASQMCDSLIVALNSDRSIQQYKSPKRPIIPLEYRLQMMTALEFVDYVTWFEETDPCALLTIIKPDIHVNGAEYGENCIEANTVKSHGGKIHIVQLVPGLSTSSVISKIQEGI